MRHRRAGRKLNRNIGQRKALFKNLISALILKGRIRTTEAKAKAIRRLVDKLINRAKQGTLGARRLIAAFLPDKKVVNKLVDQVAPSLKQRPGGFTSFKRVERRRGDNAVMVEMELIDQQTVGVGDLTSPLRLRSGLRGAGEKIEKDAKRRSKKRTAKKRVAKSSPRKAGQLKIQVKNQRSSVAARRQAAAVQKRGGGN